MCRATLRLLTSYARDDLMDLSTYAREKQRGTAPFCVRLLIAQRRKRLRTWHVLADSAPSSLFDDVPFARAGHRPAFNVARFLARSRPPRGKQSRRLTGFDGRFSARVSRRSTCVVADIIIIAAGRGRSPF